MGSGSVRSSKVTSMSLYSKNKTNVSVVWLVLIRAATKETLVSVFPAWSYEDKM